MELHQHPLSDDSLLEGSLPIALQALEERMRRQSDRRAKVALQVQVCRLAGLSRAEIQQRLALSAHEYAHAWRKLREALQPGADDA